MSTQSFFRRLAASALLLMAIAATPSLAQPDTASMPADEYSGYSDPSNEWRQSPLMKKFEAQLAWKSLDYWTNRLNEYKSRIDRTVEPCDLAELNRLRVYWSMFLDEKKWEGVVDGVGEIFDRSIGAGMTGGNEYDYSTPVPVEVPYEGEEYATQPAELYEDEPISPVEVPTEEAYATYDASQATEVEVPVSTEMEVMDAPDLSYNEPDSYHPDTTVTYQYYGEGEPVMPDASSELREELDMEQTMRMVDKVSEMVETFFVAKWIARRYRPEFNKIRQTLETDLTGFMDTLLLFRDNFVREHSTELAQYPAMREDLEKVTRGEMDKALSEVNGEEWAMIAYNMVVEPMLLLYNGQDLRGLLREVDALPAEISALDIPEMSALRQNVPNPAATATTITYVLKEESRRTMLRLYNARGEMVIEENLGSRSAGEHQAELDISKLPAGSYLYHLTVNGSRGEQVHSKTMQIVR